MAIHLYSNLAWHLILRQQRYIDEVQAIPRVKVPNCLVPHLKKGVVDAQLEGRPQAC